MKLKLAIFVAFAATVAFVAPRFPVQTAQANDRASADVAARIRPLGLSVVGQPARHGEIYIVNALDPRGAEMRVIMDAQDGSLVSIGPSPVSSSFGYSPHYDASPRIINIAPVDNDDYAEPAPRRSYQNRARSDSLPPRAVEPRRAVREVTPPRERPRDVNSRVDLTPPAPETNTAAPDNAQRDEIRRSLEQERRANVPPPPTPKSESSKNLPRWRPRTVLAPPPYADPNRDLGPSPLKPLHRRDSNRFAPSADQVDDSAAAPPEDVLRSEARASVPQILPQIPAPPRAVGMPVAQTQLEQKPAAEAALDNPEDSPPPGNAVGDFAPAKP